MLKQLNLNNFTAFTSATVDFSPGVNVVIGQNGTGKTHILKAAYAMMAFHGQSMQELGGFDKDYAFQDRILAKKLLGVFRASQLKKLVRISDSKSARIRCSFGQATQYDIEIAPDNNADGYRIERRKPFAFDNTCSVIYLPTRELLTFAPGFAAIYDKFHLPFEETWKDTCLALTSPLSKDLDPAVMNSVILPLEKAMGGTLETDEGGRFVLKTERGDFEIHLVAEGFRKLATLARIVATGQLSRGSTLFWDEPEANLNPALIRVAAQVILALGTHGVQVVLATHSVYLLRELYILQRSLPDLAKTGMHFIGLTRAKDQVTVSQGDHIEELPAITALDEELIQADRYIDAANGLKPQSADRTQA